MHPFRKRARSKWADCVASGICGLQLHFPSFYFLSISLLLLQRFWMVLHPNFLSRTHKVNLPESHICSGLTSPPGPDTKRQIPNILQQLSGSGCPAWTHADLLGDKSFADRQTDRQRLLPCEQAVGKQKREFRLERWITIQAC